MIKEWFKGVMKKMKDWLGKVTEEVGSWVDGGKRKKEKAQAEALEAYEKTKREEEQEEQAKRAKEFETYVQSWVDEGKKRGMDEHQALKWAKRKIEEQAEKHRMRGHLIVCEVCGKQGANHKTGGMVKKADGTYRHQNCRG